MLLMTTYDWIKSFLIITIERRAIYGNLENKINTLYLARIVEVERLSANPSTIY
jgi:hypothetical protein